jgi:pimeloyl-ACP methyl ester carboxylesterase
MLRFHTQPALSRARVRHRGAQAGRGAAQRHAPLCCAAAYAHAPLPWTWRGHAHAYVAAGPAEGAPCLLLHGFGVSSLQWRESTAALAAAGRRVYALDLLGFGDSVKPDLEYSIELWRDAAIAFLAEYAGGRPALLVGNSIGSLVALAVAAEAPPGTCAGVVLHNCAGGMNNTARSDDWRAALALPLFALINALLRSPLARPLFDSVRKRDSIQGLLRGLYAAAPERADAQLVDAICAAAAQDGALGAAVRIIAGPGGPRPEALLELGPARDVPLCVVWGDIDALTPHDGPLGRYFAALPSRRAATRFHLLPGLGHCAFDEAPQTVLPLVLDFVASLEA